MPHQCVRCNTFYPDGDAIILKGCPCGGKLFFYIKQEKLDRSKSGLNLKMSQNDREQIEEDVFNIIGERKDDPVVLDIESVRVLGPGKYELDLVHLFRNEPVIFKVEDGKYIIDLPETFRRLQKKV